MEAEEGYEIDESELIIGVAIRHNRMVVGLPKPKRHHDVIRHMVNELGITPPINGSRFNQGFYTASGLFLNRMQAYAWVRKNGQCDNPKSKILTSEDLW